MSYKIKGSLKRIYKALSGKDTSASSISGILDDIATASEGGGIELPAVTATDNGDVLTVVSGKWAKAELPSTGLPEMTFAEAGTYGLAVTVDVETEEQTLAWVKLTE